MYYKESEQINLIKEVFSYVICIVLASILGYLYAILTIFNPVLYLSFLTTVGFGFILGLICRGLVRLSHNRSKKHQIIQAIIIGILGNYAQWTAYILYVFNETVPPFGLYIDNLHWFVFSENFFAAIVKINTVGIWSIFGITFKGFVLTIVWVIEFLIIAVLPVIAVIKAPTRPYSELLKKWYPKYTLIKDFESISTGNQFRGHLKSAPLEAIDSLQKGNGLRYSKIHLFYLKDEEAQYLTLEKIFIGGKGKKDSSIIINNFLINQSDVEQIFKKYDYKKEQMGII